MFGIGFLSNNVMLPILDFFYGIVPSYGLAIVALTLVIRFSLYPLSAGSIRNMRRMKVAQPVMQKKVKEVQEKYKDDPAEQQAAMSEIYKEFGNPLAGCFPLLLQMPILFALFATLRGSPFANITYPIDVQVLPTEKIEQVQPQAFSTKPQNFYVSDGVHYPVIAVLPGGNRLGVGEETNIRLQTEEGRTYQDLLTESTTNLSPTWQILEGQDFVQVDENGHLEALQPGKAKVQATLPGLAANKGFLFVQALGRVGAVGEEGDFHWDIIGMVLFFGVSLYVNQLLSGQNSNSANPQQAAIAKYTPVLFTGMFFFFPLPAGVLVYMVIANVFQTAQTFILSREPLPENLQKIVDAEERAESLKSREPIPFEKRSSPKKAKETTKKDKEPKRSQSSSNSRRNKAKKGEKASAQEESENSTKRSKRGGKRARRKQEAAKRASTQQSTSQASASQSQEKTKVVKTVEVLNPDAGKGTGQGEPQKSAEVPSASEQSASEAQAAKTD